MNRDEKTNYRVAFITGITGQDGSYLAELLIDKGYKVYGIVRRTSSLFNDTRIAGFRDSLTLHYGDLTDGPALQNLILSIVAENDQMERLEIYNLAAQSHVKVSFILPEYTSLVDGIGTLKLLQIIKNLDPEIRSRCRLYQASTSEMFGRVLETPQKESTPFNPVSPYAVSKVYSHYMVRVYRESYDIYACNGILFNHESPRRGPNFLTMKVVNGVKRIVSGKNKFPIHLGNLYSKRDWGHAKDYVRGMWMMLQRKYPVDYILATGESHTVKSFVTKAFAYKGLEIRWEGKGTDEIAVTKEGNTVVDIDPAFYRPCEVDELIGDAKKAETDLGWKREFYNLDMIIKDMFSGS